MAQSCLFLLRPLLRDSPSPFLSQDENERLAELTPIFQAALQQDFDHQVFLDGLCQQDEVGLELLWRLHQLGLVTLGCYLCSCQSGSAAAFSRSLISLCTQPPPELQPAVSPLASGLLAYLVFYGFSGDSAWEKSLVKTSVAILETVVCKLVDFGEVNRERPLSLAVFHSPLLEASVLQRFSRHSLSLLLQHNPTIRVLRAVQEQSRWVPSSLPAPTLDFLQQALSVLPPQASCQLLFQLLEGREVNWRHLLATVSVLVSLHGTELLEEVASKLLQQAFCHLQPELLMGSFLLARQWSLTHSPNYQDWFKKYLGDSSLVHSAQTFKFLMGFLTKLVPAEPAQYLKAHIFCPPNIVSRPIYNEYLHLAKTRLSDLQEPLEKMSLFHNSGGDGKVQGDVDQALKLYAEAGKLPNTILEASIFRKSYFVGHFLPALLTPTPLSAVPDVKMKFIQELHKAKRIPTKMYDTFQQECSKATSRLVEEMRCEDLGLEVLEPEEEVQSLRGKLLSALAGESAEEVQHLAVQIASALVQLPLQQAALLFWELWASLPSWDTTLVESLSPGLVKALCSHLRTVLHTPSTDCHQAPATLLLLRISQLEATPLCSWLFGHLPFSDHFMRVSESYLRWVGQLAPDLPASLLPPSLLDKFQFGCLRASKLPDLPSSLLQAIRHQLSFQRWLELESDMPIDEPWDPSEKLAYVRRVATRWNKSAVVQLTLSFLLESHGPVHPSLISLLHQGCWEKLPQDLLQEHLRTIFTHTSGSLLKSRLHRFFRVVEQLPKHLLWGQVTVEQACALVCKLHPLVEAGDLALPQHVTACLLASCPQCLLELCPLLAFSAVCHRTSLPLQLDKCLQWAVELEQALYSPSTAAPEARLRVLLARQAFCLGDPPPSVVQEVAQLVSQGVVSPLDPSASCPHLPRLLPPEVWRPGYPLACLRVLLLCRTSPLDPAVWLDLALRNLTLCYSAGQLPAPLTSQLCQVAAALPSSILHKLSKEVVKTCPAPLQLILTTTNGQTGMVSSFLELQAAWSPASR